MTRKNARQAALCMIFDYSFHSQDTADEQLDLYIENFQDSQDMCISKELRCDDYFTKVYFGVISNIPVLDDIINKCSKKWNISRIVRDQTEAILPLFECLNSFTPRFITFRTFF